MDAVFSGTRVVDLVIGLTLLEGAALIAYRRATGRGLPAADFVPNLAAGLCLMLALRGSLAGAAWPWIALCLLGAGLAHGADVWRRWGASRRGVSGSGARR